MFLKSAIFLQYAKLANQKMIYLSPIQTSLKENQLDMFDLIPQENRSLYLDKPFIKKRDDLILVFQNFLISQTEGYLDSSEFNRSIFMVFALVYQLKSNHLDQDIENEILEDFTKNRNLLIEEIDITKFEKERFFLIKTSDDLQDIIPLSSNLENISINHFTKIISLITICLILLFMFQYLSRFLDSPNNNTSILETECEQLEMLTEYELESEKNLMIDHLNNNQIYLNFFVNCFDQLNHSKAEFIFQHLIDHHSSQK